jgi:hypothetical protein
LLLREIGPRNENPTDVQRTSLEYQIDQYARARAAYYGFELKCDV